MFTEGGGRLKGLDMVYKALKNKTYGTEWTIVSTFYLWNGCALCIVISSRMKCRVQLTSCESIANILQIAQIIIKCIRYRMAQAELEFYQRGVEV